MKLSLTKTPGNRRSLVYRLGRVGEGLVACARGSVPLPVPCGSRDGADRGKPFSYSLFFW
jgi:hypothetical protein